MTPSQVIPLLAGDKNPMGYLKVLLKWEFN